MTPESIPGFSLVFVKAPSLRSGELARLAGVSPDTLRHYERIGVLARPRRKVNGYRQYDPAALDRVLLVRRALALGFTLQELRRLLAARERGKPPCHEMRRLASAKLAEIDLRLVQMRELRDLLARTLADWDARLDRTPEGRPAGLLESLAGEPASSSPHWARRGALRKEEK